MSCDEVDTHNAITTIRLHWFDSDQDFGFVFVTGCIESKSLSDIRRDIALQFSAKSTSSFTNNDSFISASIDNHICLQNGSFSFIIDGLIITSKQESIVLVLSLLPRISLRAHPTVPLVDSESCLDDIDITSGFAINQQETEPFNKALFDDNISPSSTNYSNYTSSVVFDAENVLIPLSDESSMFTSTNQNTISINVHTSAKNQVNYSSMAALLKNIMEYNTTDGSVVWIDIHDYTDEDIALIGRQLQLHPLTVEDIMSESTRQKVEGFSKYMFVVLHTLEHILVDDERIANVNIILLESLCLTLHRKQITPMNLVKKRIQKVFPDRIPSSFAALHAIVDCMIDADLAIVNAAVTEVNTLEDLVYMLSQYEQSDLLKRMGLVRRRLTLLRQKLWPKRDIIVNLMHTEWRKFIKNMRVAYFRDVYDHVLVMIQKLEMASEMLSSLQSTYLAKVSIEVAEASNNLDEIMKKLTSVATILLPMTFVTGLFGMNVKVPWQFDGNMDADTADDGATHTNDSLYAFYGIIGAMCLCSAPFYFWLRRRNWV